MSDVKFSQFTTGGDMQVGDIVVGLRADTNTQYTFPGLGIKDSFGNYLFQYATSATGFTNVDFLVLTNSLSGGSPALTVAGADTNIPLAIHGKGTGPIVLSGQRWPISDGTPDQVLTTDGSGNLFWGVEAGSGTVSFGSANELAFYAVSGVVVSGLPTANNGVLVTDGTGVPSIGNTLPINVTNNITTLGTIVSGVWNGSTIDVGHGGTGVTLFSPFAIVCGGTAAGNPLQQVSGLGNAAQILTSQGPDLLPVWLDNTTAGFTWNNITVPGPTTLIDKNGYIANDAGSQVLFQLPALAAIGEFYSIAGNSVLGWQLQMGGAQTVLFGNLGTSAGGTITSSNQGDQIDIVCVATNTVFRVHSALGNLTLA